MTGIHARARRVLAALLALSLGALCACGADSGAPSAATPAEPPAPAAAVEAPLVQPAFAPPGAESAAESAPSDGALSAVAPNGEDGFCHVASVEELLEAIHPLAGIVIEPGRYNLSAFLANFPNPRDWDAWNESHKYVQIRDVYDGLEIVVRNTTDLYIEGGSDDPADTELVTQPRYANVLRFENCTGIELCCLTMGHTDTGDCSGSVLKFENTQMIRLRTMDLYGCGVYGISATDGSGDLECSNSTIRDCEYGPFEIYDANGPFTFTACTFSGSRGGGMFWENGHSTLSFAGCLFGEQESNRWYFDESAAFEDCVWSEITEYPDIMPYDFDPAYEPEDAAQAG